MQQVLYSSVLSRDVGPGDIAEILRCSRRNNPELGIGGVLTLRGPNAVQVLEGPPDAVDPLVDYIRSDTRHRDITVLLRRTVARGQFADWAMGYLSRPLSAADLADPETLVDRLAVWMVHQGNDADSATGALHLPRAVPDPR